ncbi:hypothetical protein SAMN05216548_10766 [Faunimonas pinastri]|uniref:ChbG/HpnK family deacetylase n=1 Tax=Faunimonas pinastri TaxID=1855383 RepID=A0A1H9IDA0_9HYPH|nr:ChbG/HpnK family deacetylase [Faunimonas pinastri]SEQ72472.1 hypothetical protein SAMN05216548_10766 [Faunimonas pinastri]
MRIVLCADDYGLAEGVSRGILALGRAGRLSATGAMVTTDRWKRDAAPLRELRLGLALGLHLNLTTGRAVSPVPELAPSGDLPALKRLMALAFSGRLPEACVRAEIHRQLDRFEREIGNAPDFVDGHQHVHVLPTVRSALLSVLRERYAGRALLVRDPADRADRILRRGGPVAKALFVGTLARGFAEAVREAGFRANDSFAGFSPFDEKASFGQEFQRFLRAPGELHLIMCHPGFPDPELAALDPVVGRRRQEFDALMRRPDLPALLWPGWPRSKVTRPPCKAAA